MVALLRHLTYLSKDVVVSSNFRLQGVDDLAGRVEHDVHPATRVITETLTNYPLARNYTTRRAALLLLN
jgi:hypothetical protein